MTRPPPARIVILGGGTAGWMAANLFAHHWGGERVTLVESPEVGIIGVGEGSTPQFAAFFRTLGIAEADWMPRCNATYKTGIRFNDWSRRAGFESYFHPFQTGIDRETMRSFFYNAMARRTGRDVFAHPDRFFLPARLAAHRQGPLPAEPLPFDLLYGYHFDAYLVGAMLRTHATGLGVSHLERHVAAVARTENGDVSHLITSEGEQIAGDLFVDSSGFRSSIMQEALGERFISFAENLFNDRAVVMPTPADACGTNAHTSATAKSAGWIWDIPLTNRTGNGYVFASGFITPDKAETELRAHLGMLESDVAARHLQMKVGRVDRSWVRNCLAIGLAQGFIEPLEATALHIVQTTIELFIEGHDTGSPRDAFNAAIVHRYDGIRDYIVAHYRMNQRGDTDYWRENAANQALSDTLKTLMTAWFRAQDLTEVIDDLGISDCYSSQSWHCLFAGYGTFPPDHKIMPPGPDIEHIDLAEIDRFLEQWRARFTDHKQLLDGISGTAIPKEHAA